MQQHVTSGSMNTKDTGDIVEKYLRNVWLDIGQLGKEKGRE